MKTFRAFLRCLLAIAAVLCLVSCPIPGQDPVDPTPVDPTPTPTPTPTPAGQDLVWQPVSGSAVFPWVGDSKSIATEDGRLYFYFMAGEGTEVSGVAQKIGDSNLVVFPNGKVMLIDACSSAYTQTLIANLNRLGIKKIDYLVFTHGHSDHYQGFTASDGIAEHFTIDHVWYNGTTCSGNTAIINKCKAKGIGYSSLKEGDSLNIGAVSIDILNPPAEIQGTSVTAEADQNNASLCMRFTYGSVKVLFLGDMYKAGLQTLTDTYGTSLKADIVKMPHHGHSETSVLQEFASKVSPKYAVASSGAPVSIAVYQMWTSAGAKFLDDYTMGYIFIATDGTKIDAETSRERETDFYNRFDGKSTTVPSYVPDGDNTGYYGVSSVDALISAVSSGKAKIRLDADIDISAYTIENPLELNMNSKVLDLNGHTVSGCTGTVPGGQGSSTILLIDSNLILNGAGFTIKNGTFRLTGNAGGYAFRINSTQTAEHPASKPVILQGVSIPNGGVNINACTVRIERCSFIQPSTCTTNRPVICLYLCKCTIDGGIYRYLGSYTYDRWLRMYSSDIYIGNGVSHYGTIYYKIDESRIDLKRTLL